MTLRGVVALVSGDFAHKGIVLERILGALCLAILAGILIVGLWPFGRPKNGVWWLAQVNGIAIRGYGTLWSSAPLGAPPGAGSGLSADRSLIDTSCSLEVWVRPRSTGSRTILSVFDAADPRKFVLRQSNADLVIRVAGGRRRVAGPAAFEVDDVFEPGKQVFLTLTAGGQGTAVYVNGQWAKSSSEARFSFANLEGTLILSGLATNHDPFEGEILGLAIYNRELQPDEVSRHFMGWTQGREPEIRAGQRPVAVYTFDERRGNVVESKVSGGPALEIPERFAIREQFFLESPFREFRMESWYWKDVAVNVAGFIPLGLIFCAYFSQLGYRHASLATVLFGAAVTLTIEMLQSHLPTRDSSSTDVITNMTGTCIGVWLYARVSALLGGAAARRSPHAAAPNAAPNSCPIQPEFK